MCNVIWQNSVLLLLMNIIINTTYSFSGIYTNFRKFLCKKCDIGYDGVKKTDDYWLVFIVSISLLHKILNARQNCSLYFP